MFKQFTFSSLSLASILLCSVLALACSSSTDETAAPTASDVGDTFDLGGEIGGDAHVTDTNVGEPVLDLGASVDVGLDDAHVSVDANMPDMRMLQTCATHGEACSENATCTDTNRGYECACNAGFSGDDCETNIDDCANRPCQNDGRCEDEVSGYRCVCAAGFSGDDCETNIDDCANRPCQNDGRCEDEVSGYRCVCAAGFSGDDCETNIDDCATARCLDGARCVDLINDFECVCLDGRYGDDCSESLCGDGVVVLSEACDDADALSGNGCDAQCRVEWAYFCEAGDNGSHCISICGDGLKASDEGCDDGNAIRLDGCSESCEVETPVTFDCAIANHEAQMAIAPDYIYTQSNGDKAFNADRQPWARNWEPILEPVPGCNGGPWDANAVDQSLKVFKFLVVLDKSWVDYYEVHAPHFATQGYDTLEASPKLLFDRASYIYEAQFGVRLDISRVIAIEGLTEKCATNNSYVENGVRDASNTQYALEQRDARRLPTESGILRLGVGSATPNQYCHSAAPLNGVCGDRVFTNQKKPFEGDTGVLSHRASVTLAHEMGHFFGICSDASHPHCLNAHLANEIPDIMVWNGVPAEEVRTQGMFYKFFSSCTPVYDELLCGKVKTVPAQCGTLLTCENGGLDCETPYWTARGAQTNDANQAMPQEIKPRAVRFPVRCCSGDPAVSCTSKDLGGLISVSETQRECSGLMTWPQADRFCRQAGRRLCSVDELATDLCSGGGCGYGPQRVWSSTPALSLEDFVGTYQRQPVTNGWHEVEIQLVDGQLFWRNAANRSWALMPFDRIFRTLEDSPYGVQNVEPILAKDERGQETKQIDGLKFNGDLYVRQ